MHGNYGGEVASSPPFFLTVYIEKRGVSFIEEKRYKEAKECFSFLALLDTTCKRYWQALGVTILLLNDPTKGFQSFQLLNKLDPQEPLSNFFIGYCSVKINQPDVAQHYFEKAELRANTFLYYQKAVEFLAGKKYFSLTDEELIHALQHTPSGDGVCCRARGYRPHSS